MEHIFMSNSYGSAGMAASMNQPLFEKALLQLDSMLRTRSASDNDPFVICDYGCAAGIGFLAHVKTLIDVVRQTLKTVPIVLIFEDQPENKFNLLVSNITDFRNELMNKYDNLQFLIASLGFFTKCLPANFVNIGVCCSAVSYLSKRPVVVPDTYMGQLSQFKHVKDAVAKQAEQDWESFLESRAYELKPGGEMIVLQAVVPIPSDGTLDLLYSVWKNLQKENVITEEEVQNTMYPSYGRSDEDLKRPFNNGKADSWKLECISTEELTVSFNLMEPLLQPKDEHFLELATRRIDETLAWSQHFFRAGLDRSREVSDTEVILNNLRERAILVECRNITPEDVVKKRRYTLSHIRKNKL